jgi:two-component system, LytTR family, response regulator
MGTKAIATFLVDDNKECLFDLREHLALIPEIEIVGEACQYQKAKELILAKTPDLLFLDIEMPYKNGFQLLEEIRLELKKPFKVVFNTAYDKYVIEALRQSAFDFLVKPAQPDEIKIVIDRYKKRLSGQVPAVTLEQFKPFMNIVPLPINIGIKFVERNHVVYLHCNKNGLIEKPIWEAVLSNLEKVKLKQNITADELTRILGAELIVKINKSTLVNRNYISLFEYKSHRCFLVPPFEDVDLVVSRQHIPEFRSYFGI